MADRISADRRSENMRRIKGQDTQPEMVVRKMVHAMGYRYRLHRKDLPGKPDLVFSPRRKVIFVHGCFWHQHDDPECSTSHRPRSNNSYWDAKLSKNVERDAVTQQELIALGWESLTVWECETKDTEGLKDKLRRYLS